MRKKILFIAAGTTFFFSSHAAWYDAPLRWFNQGIAWMRQSSYNAYQKALALAGYRAYQQQTPSFTQPIQTDERQIIQVLRKDLSSDITAAITATELLTLLEQQWREEIQEKKPRYPVLLEKQQMNRYPALQQGMLERYPQLNSLSKYDHLIGIIKDSTIDPFSYFPSISSTLNKLPVQERNLLEPIIRDIIVWITRTKEYFNSPFASKYSLSQLQNQLRYLQSRLSQ